jgi:hypothetical protein
MAERYFNRKEAEDLLPVIADSLERARREKRKIDSLDRELAQAATRIMVLGGSIPPSAKLAATRSEREQFAAQLQEAIVAIQETGCIVKDLEEGLVDFPSLRGGEEIYLCWKLGEKRIDFWHGIEEGFAGRKPLDDTGADDVPPLPPKVQ